MSRDDRNLGGATDRALDPTASRAAVLMVDRLILGVLKEAIDQVKDSEAELTRFFSHFFDPTVGAEERAQFVTNFQRQPPKALLGYARSSAQFPCFAVVLENEEETDAFLGDYVGQILPDEDPFGEPSEYTGSFFQQTYGVYIYAEHPDQCSYLYHFAKAVLISAKEPLLSCGVQEVILSGGELAPNDDYLPENMFVRVLRAQVKSATTVPRLLSADPRKIKILGLYMEDIVVDGIRGGVHPYEEPDDA